jgi:hypothetical protein
VHEREYSAVNRNAATTLIDILHHTTGRLTRSLVVGYQASPMFILTWMTAVMYPNGIQLTTLNGYTPKDAPGGLDEEAT